MNLCDLTTDSLTSILLYLEPENLYQLSRVNKRINSVCNGWYFRQEYEEIWQPTLIRRYQDDRRIGLYWAGRLSSRRLFEYFYSQQGIIEDIYSAFEGAGYANNPTLVNYCGRSSDEYRGIFNIQHGINAHGLLCHT